MAIQNPVEQVYYLNIARADAATVLNKLARQTDSVLIYSYEQAAAHQANAIYGYFTLFDALDYVLLNSGLAAKTLANGSIKIAQRALPVVAQTQQANQPEQMTEPAPKSKKVEIIQVDGIRRSLYKAQDIKKQSDTIVDVIVAEDIGKLPDITAAESIARLTGVQVTRFNDEVDSVLIRGLPFFTTTYNGREFFTAEKRLASLQDFPSQAIAEIEVYKSSSADIIDPGLAGLVNIRTRRPFDFEGEKIAGGLHYSYNDQSEQSAPNGNILYTNRWLTELGEVGFLANLTYAASDYYNGVRYNATWFTQIPDNWQISPDEYEQGGFLLPGSVGLYNSGAKRWRPSANFSAQWQVTPELELYLEGIFQGYRSDKYIDYFNVSLTDSSDTFGDPVLSDVVTQQINNDILVESITKSAGQVPWIYRHTEHAQTDTYQYAIGGIWQNDGVKISSDLAMTDSQYFANVWSVDTALSQPQTVKVNFLAEQGGPSFSFENFNALDESQYLLRGYYESRYKTTGKNIQWRSDIAYTTDWQYIYAVQAGIRVAKRKTSREDGGRYASLLDLNKPIAELTFLDLTATDHPYRDNQQAFSQYLAPSRSSIVNNQALLAEVTYQSLLTLAEQGEEWAEKQAVYWQSSKIEANPLTHFSVNESTYSGYLQAKTYFELAPFDFDMISGIRLVKTESESAGFSGVTINDETDYQPVNQAHSYWDILPNLHLMTDLTEQIKLRLAYAKTITRPDFSDLNPSVSLNIQADTTTGNIGIGGNPNLKTVRSDNYDLSLEYYFSDSGAVSLATFYRDLFGFINQQAQTVDDPEYGTIEVIRPVNSGKGKIYGYELNFQTFFDFLGQSWKGFGLTANTTYQKGFTRDPDNNGGYGQNKSIAGLSNWTHNLALFYEKDSLNARLSYNYRSAWINWYADSASTGFAGNKIRARDRIDLSVSYELDKHLTLYADVSNLLAKPFKNYTYINENLSYPQDIRDEGRYFGIGLRFNY
ncbi:TonB-dependent receptor [Catenovulum sp. 2E275]|uniref:TonB-dependent receptor n=1 Tax=Catenovulum sp. 2E275 TaxID=2980497 RepID=UPI0021D1CD97|nr:TonB-dependent receptor [Catenovulum sp. 2E275]MCU4677299.1 TonB-dependent receptor [Catenovulum sp. 2E275]